ncbi:hypothetical protein [Nonomuraea rhodomycinica]|uniref:Uncharacterized protein n=1 Tax=Nonomuraea rhodomycinica TaxID=1712872 RepID=A0A7Y6IWB2_9ACTN|nr:hypothetical protein [Nonomuraea rhodomycinica]NUW45562.1 hypothetical protein [Nonomuraea rhodomycinica]
MEPSRVELHNWPYNPAEPGGWVAPYGNPIHRWRVTHVHARYIAPKVLPGDLDEHGRPMKPRIELHAYLVDLDGSQFGLPDHEHVLLHQVPPVGWWLIKPADDEHLARIARFKV